MTPARQTAFLRELDDMTVILGSRAGRLESVEISGQTSGHSRHQGRVLISDPESDPSSAPLVRDPLPSTARGFWFPIEFSGGVR